VKTWLTLFILVGILSACANRWREGELDKSINEIEGYVALTLDGANGDARGLSQARDLKNDPNTVIYYTEAPSDLGPIYAVTPFFRLDFLSQQVYTNEVRFIRVTFLDRALENGSHQGALIFDIEKNDGTKIVDVFVNDSASGLSPGFVSEGLFEMQLRNSSGNTIKLYSDDTTDDDELADVLQFNVTDVQDTHYGKLSTMIGYY
jgi:hypothetical protein